MKKALLTIAMLAATFAFAQDPAPAPPPPGPGMGGGMMGMHRPGFGPMGRGGWWKNSKIAEELKLTDQQKQQLEKTFTDYRLQLIDQRAAVEREETKLQPLMDADQLDKAKINSQLDALIAARSKLEKTAAMMHVSMREILTPDQWKQLQAMHAQRREMRQDRRQGRGMMKPGMRRQAPQQPAPPSDTQAPPPPGE